MLHGWEVFKMALMILFKVILMIARANCPFFHSKVNKNVDHRESKQKRKLTNGNVRRFDENALRNT